MTQPRPGPQTQPELDAMIPLEDIIAHLRQQCDLAGGVEQWANRHRIASVFVHLALDGRAKPTEAILGALGYQRRESYVRVKP